MHPTPPPEYDGGVLGQLHIAMIRLDAKVDGINTRIGEFTKAHDDHETRLRLLEARPHVRPERLEALENRPSVSPATVWKALGFAVAVLGIIVPILVAAWK
jgi:hypothetical protein